MSLMKWTLAVAGAAMGVRYMSDRHRKRLSASSDEHDSSMRAAQTDRDSETAWSTPQGGLRSSGLASPSAGLGSGTTTGYGSGEAGTTGYGSGESGTTARSDDLLSPDSNTTPGSSTNRF